MADGIYFNTRSRLDGSPIVVVLRGAIAASSGAASGANRKTGAMIQSYIMPRGADPATAAASGADRSVCGDCPLRPTLARESGGSRCYVNLGHGPRSVWHAYQAGSYRRARFHFELVEYVRGLPLRIGAWGDPAACDPILWHKLARAASGHTGYTHQWRGAGAALRGIVMASVGSAEERDAAQALGWATFRVSTDPGEKRARGEAICPASAEAGHRVTCATCPIPCDGRSGGRVILDHGPGGVGRRLRTV